MGNDILRIENLSKKFGSVKAVDAISLSVQAGEIFGFLGPNGAGKTTTIGMILGLIYPDNGTVQVLGERVTPKRNWPLRGVGALVGPPSLLPYFSARQNLEVMARLEDDLPPDAIEKALDLTGLSEAADRKAGHFSTGMKQRLGLAIALLHDPDLLILDEPTNGMDPVGMREMRELLKGLSERGVTVFLSSHLLHEVEQICSRVAILNRGKIVAEGEVNSLLSDQQVVYVKVDAPFEAAQALQSLPGASQIQPNGNCVTLRHPSSQAVNEHLARNGIYASELSSGRPDLESLFLELTQE